MDARTGLSLDPSISVHRTATSPEGIPAISAILSSSTSKAQRSMCREEKQIRAACMEGEKYDLRTMWGIKIGPFPHISGEQLEAALCVFDGLGTEEVDAGVEAEHQDSTEQGSLGC